MHEIIITTVPDLCKRCYSCIRECPAKAIRVVAGQAHVISERCIACGHCVKVCSQDAKRMLRETDQVMSFMETGKVIAIVAPSFAASFPDNFLKVPNAMRSAGFDYVIETAFGADLISQHYVDEFLQAEKKPIISSSCPAVTNFIQKYYPELVPNLAKIVSPMIALGRYLRASAGEEYKIVFVGPCIAKKEEYADPDVEGVIDSAITFLELKEIFRTKGIDINAEEESGFDPPHSSLGKAYPLAGGLLKAADLPNDVLDKEIIVVEGKSKVLGIIDEIANNHINARFIDILFCEGCISGPVIDSTLNYYGRREKVIEFIRSNVSSTDKKLWKSTIFNAREVNLKRGFTKSTVIRPLPDEAKIRQILSETGKNSVEQELNCGACGYPTCREHAIAIAQGLGEKEMCLPYLIDEIQIASEHLRLTQDQLHSAEKLASIGQLAAGVAHEINNPLGTIMLYASLLKRQLSKLELQERTSEDLDLIVREANRCKSIVANLLNFARQGKLNISEFDGAALLRVVLKKMSDEPRFSAVEFIDELPEHVEIQGDREQLEQVFVNVISNACESMEESPVKKLRVRAELFRNKPESAPHKAVFSIIDTGCGIDKDNFNKVFTPFFTTKKMGKGTGLGMAIVYGIIKMHKGDITFTSVLKEGTSFFISLPLDAEPENMQNHR